MRGLSIAFALMISPVIAPPPWSPDPGFAALVAGNDLAQFEVVGLDENTMAIVDGEVRLDGRAKGYFATKRAYHNYHLQFDWLYERHKGKPSDGNSGLMLHMDGPAKVWPRAIEVQIWYKEYGDFYTLDGARFSPKKDDRAARDRALKPLGEWNHQEVICKDGTIAVRLNGVEYAGGRDARPDRGRIGWMAEGSSIRFRRLQIKATD